MILMGFTQKNDDLMGFNGIHPLVNIQKIMENYIFLVW
jgi:hypothetical protein